MSTKSFFSFFIPSDNTANKDECSAGLRLIKCVYLQTKVSYWTWPVILANLVLKREYSDVLGVWVILWKIVYLSVAVLAVAISGIIGFLAPLYFFFWTSFESADFSRPFFKQGIVLLSLPLILLFTFCTMIRVSKCVCFWPLTKDYCNWSYQKQLAQDYLRSDEEHHLIFLFACGVHCPGIFQVLEYDRKLKSKYHLPMNFLAEEKTDFPIPKSSK